MSHHAWLPLALVAASCARPAPVAPCPQIAPVAATPIATPAESVAIVFVVQGEEMWVGNDDIEPEIDPTDKTGMRPNPVRHLGALKALKRAVDGADFGSIAFPAKAAVITYADRVTVRVPMGPIDEVDGAAFGSQRDYYGRLGRSLTDAIGIAIDELEGVDATRKVLVIIGDATDTDVEAASQRLKVLRREIDQARIVTSAIVYKSPLSDPFNLFRTWPGFVDVHSGNDFEHVFTRIKKRVSRPSWTTSVGKSRCETC